MRNNIEVFPDFLSQARLRPYVTEAGYYALGPNKLEQAIELYRWNLSFSAELYKAIACIEIPLRNALDKALHQCANSQGLCDWTNWFGNSIGNNSPSIQQHVDTLIGGDLRKAHRWAAKAAKSRFSKRSSARIDRECTHDDIVSQLTFGVWTKLIGKAVTNEETEDTQQLWQTTLSSAFPRAHQNEAGRVYIAQQLYRIHDVRNRIAHYENILYLNANEFINSALTLLYCIDPTLTHGWMNVSGIRHVAAKDPRRNQRIRKIAFKLTSQKIGGELYSAEQILEELITASNCNNDRVLFCNNISVRPTHFGRIKTLYLYANGSVARGTVAEQGLCDDTHDPLNGIDGYERPQGWGGDSNHDRYWYAINGLQLISPNAVDSLCMLTQDKTLRAAFMQPRTNRVYLR